MPSKQVSSEVFGSNNDVDDVAILGEVVSLRKTLLNLKSINSLLLCWSIAYQFGYYYC